jgi:HEAT repeat protein
MRELALPLQLILILLTSFAFATPRLATRSTAAAPETRGTGVPLRIAANGDVQLPNGQRIARLATPPTRPRTVLARRLNLSNRELLHLKLSRSKDRDQRAAKSGPLEPAAAAPATELVIELGQAPPRVVFNGRTGPQGRDGEYERVLQLSERHILLFQRRAGWTKCNGEPMRLFPRLYDFDAGRFRAARVRPDSATSLPVLRPARALPPVIREALAAGRPPLHAFVWQAASSDAHDAGQADRLTPPTLLADGDLTSAWTEGAGGHGIGTRLVARRSWPSPPVSGILIVPGAASTARARGETNRLKSAVLQVGDDASDRYLLHFVTDPLPRLRRKHPYFWIPLPQPRDARCVSLTIASVYPGNRARRLGPAAGRTALAELRLVTTADMTGGLAPLLADMTSDDRDRRTRSHRVLARQGPAALPALEQLAKGSTPQTRDAIVKLAVRMRTRQTAGLLVSLLSGVSASAREMALAELQRQGPPLPPSVFSLLKRAPEALRLSLVALLGHVGGQNARSTLLALAGQGSVRQRAAVVRALAARGTEACDQGLVEAWNEAPSPLAQADLLAAAGRCCASLPAARRIDLATQATKSWEDGAAFELRFRLIEMIGTLAPAKHLKGLLQHATDQAEPPLRALAVRQIANAPQSATRTHLLRGALADRDPRVRRAALDGLSRTRPALEAVAPDLVDLLRRERWPMVAQAVVAALEQLCSRIAIAPLRRALTHPSARVGNAAAAALARCAPEALLEETLQFARDRKLSADRRGNALRSLPSSVAARHPAPLLALLVDLRRSARSDADLHLVSACLAALSASPSAKVAEVLARWLTEDPDQTIRATAADAIARHCAPETRPALERATRDPSTTVQRIARNTLRRCLSKHQPRTNR